MNDEPGLAYQAFYCEENIWHLGHRVAETHPRRRVLVIGSLFDHVAMWSQRAGRDPDGLVAWDYHVVLLTGSAPDTMVWDLDCRLGYPLALADWVGITFPDGWSVPPPFLPGFRLLEFDDYVAILSSDRSHMRVGDEWRRPPPPWPPIKQPGVASNVLRLADLSDPIGGEILRLDALICR